ncbi:hypothetical protein ACFYYH_06080 [Streptomyces sp. NPDC002018]|uniref:hypothetical protein n=1 Tax=Streptomyces sp. NPDC002018 TaxID=3364629 RepID=UPI0036950D18
MPRPTAAPLAYGSATVVCSTVVMLLVSGVTSGAGIVVIGIAALALGLLVTLTVAAPGRAGAYDGDSGRILADPGARRARTRGRGDTGPALDAPLVPVRRSSRARNA